MENLFAIEEPRISAVDTVIEKIKGLLIEKQLCPGDMIPSESVLAEQLKVSRGSIREAMKILSAFGVIDIRRGAGTYISNASNKKIFDPLLFRILVSNGDYDELIEVREMMEKEVVRLIIKNATEKDLQKLSECMIEFDKAEETNSKDRKTADQIDLKYHRLMGKMTHNNIVDNMYSFVVDLFAPTINSDLGYQEHRVMHEAIMEKDYEKAMKAVEDHSKAWQRNRNSVDKK
ncbi:MAG: FadR family transcriptional regulator [Spirochaetia bacterium]|nr:FadR family transcriptional regulator [Spirochaetia bacterium]